MVVFGPHSVQYSVAGGRLRQVETSTVSEFLMLVLIIHVLTGFHGKNAVYPNSFFFEIRQIFWETKYIYDGRFSVL